VKLTKELSAEYEVICAAAYATNDAYYEADQKYRDALAALEKPCLAMAAAKAANDAAWQVVKAFQVQHMPPGATPLPPLPMQPQRPALKVVK
jgi:hypothetical protein